ncbi:MBL fold metallo-hydrolase [Yinghuangia seranimata]|uniref:MBL fold metallo-hydrolase n=1 Tax=Yinghuangia seranimata TaxID=408067 RepID=UPI00248BEDD8|nr:MBL fold metallo-hydrolase [Yinghuangia seranimata]MDI2127466.1 MBL fold metallo-hydrolase [Yinghuangia seranimata]
MVHAEGDERAVWRLLAPGVFVAQVPSLKLNVTAVAGAEGFVLVDTGSYERETRGLLAGLSDVLDEHGLPDRAVMVVNTHGHFDHCYGNAEVLRRHPEALVLGHEGLPRYLARYGEEGRADAVSYGMPAEDMAAVRIVPPNRLLAVGGAHRVDLGGVEVQVYAPGRGHTGCDLVVRVPSADVLIAGDLLEESAPPSYGPDSFPAEWPATLARVLRPPAGLIVPGHGAVVDHAFALRQMEYVEARRAAPPEAPPSQ